MYLELGVEGFTPREPDVPGIVLGLLATLPLIWRRRAPLLVLLMLAPPATALCVLGLLHHGRPARP